MDYTKTYFTISDVHAAPLTYQHFIDKGFDLENPRHFIVFLGDLFDRREHNTQVLNLVIKLKEDLGDRCILIKGNHEDMLIDTLQTVISYGDVTINELSVPDFLIDLHKYNGGTTTIRDFVGGTLFGTYTLSKDIRLKSLLSFLESFEDYYETDNFIFTHASIDINRNVDNWDQDFFDNCPYFDKSVIVGHVRHEHLPEKRYVSDGEDGVMSTSMDCRVTNIDDGTGLNVCVFYEDY